MRLTRYHLFLLGGLFLVVMGPLAFTQPGPGGKGNKGGRGGFKMTADMPFTMLSGGNDFIDIKTVQIPEMMTRFESAEAMKEKMLAFNQKKGITDGKMPKAVYFEYFEERMTEMRAKWADKGKQDGGPTPAPAPGAAPTPPPDVEAEARIQFAIHDTDKNGTLSVEEMQNARTKGSRIYDERDKWDANKNGTIELPEYVEYYKGRMARRGNRGNPPAPATIPEPAKPVEEDKRPTVYRTGKMPKELPAWFLEADKDKDGQVGLYEWKASGKPVNEFMAMDLNGDGFLTVEEVLRYQRFTAKATTSPTLDPSGAPGAPSASPIQSDRSNGGGNNGGRQRGGRPKGG